MPNDSIRNVRTLVLSHNRYVVRNVTYEHRNKDGKTITLLQYAKLHALFS